MQMCFNIGAYKACCILIIVNIEHYILSDYDITNNTILKEKAIQKLNRANQETKTNKFEIFQFVHNYSLYLGINEVFKNIGDISKIDDTNFVIPNRHCLLHGYSKRQYTKKDCLFLLLLLFGFIEKKFYTEN